MRRRDSSKCYFHSKRYGHGRSQEQGPCFRPAGGPSRGPLYRSRSGMILGVCKGLARYFNVSTGLVRVIAVALLFFTGLWPVLGIYLLMGVLVKPEPVMPFESPDEQEFYDAYAGSRASAVSRLKDRFESLDRRIRRLEDRVTSKDFEWEQRLRNGT